MLPQEWGAEGQDQGAGRYAPAGAWPRCRSACPSFQSGLLNLGGHHLVGTGANLIKMAERTACKDVACPMQSGSLQGASVKRPGPSSKRSGFSELRAAGMARYLQFQLASVTEN